MPLQLALFDAAPVDIARDVVFVWRTVTVHTRSCTTDTRWSDIVVRTRVLIAFPRPYHLRFGEVYARRSALTEAQQLAARCALQETLP